MFRHLKQKFEDKYVLAAISLIVALIFGIFSIYTAFFYTKHPDLHFECISNANVYDIHEDVTDLQILYNGADIRKQGMTLSVLTIKYVNSGNDTVLPTFYDDQSPVRLDFPASSILRSTVLSASTGYVEKSFHDNFAVNANSVLLPKLIYEPNDFVLFKLLILHPEGKAIVPSVSGKVANAKTPYWMDTSSDLSQPSLYKTALSGSTVVQVLRVLFYTLAFILTVIVIVITVLFISDLLEKISRRRHIRRFKASLDNPATDNQKEILTLYLDLGIEPLLRAENILNEPEALKRFLRKETNGSPSTEPELFTQYHVLETEGLSLYLDKLITKKDGDKAMADATSAAFCKSFVTFLQAHIPQKIKQAKAVISIKANAHSEPPC